jgi:DNA-binding beta-propeller fold protein YncE/DNA-directed RNA polymerase subunit RPC12/RpoP
MSTSFNCSMCSAPLDLTHVTGPTVSCPYCGNTTLLPEELRGGMSNQMNPTIEGGFTPLVDQALKLAEVAQLYRAGNKIEAIKRYREILNCSLQEAHESLERMHTGRPIVITDKMNFQTSSVPSPQSFQTPHLAPQTIRKAKRTVFWVALIPIIFAAVIIYVVWHAVSTAINATHFNNPSMSGPPSSTSGFATNALEFGSEGIGAGQFKDARSIGIDGEGRVYVAEYQGGRVQVFDAQGKFLTQWMADAKTPIRNLAVDRKGKVYVVQSGKIQSYDGMTGTAQGEVGKPDAGQYAFYSDVYAALDGSLYAIGQNSNIVHIGSDGAIKNTIKVADKVGEKVDFDKVAVDGSGNIFALDNRQYSIFKFSSDGRYITRFGGKGKEQGQLYSPDNIAVDGQGRIYVSDTGHGIDVFDGNGRFITVFGNYEVIFGLAVNDHNEIYAVERNRHKVVKFVLSK